MIIPGGQNYNKQVLLNSGNHPLFAKTYLSSSHHSIAEKGEKKPYDFSTTSKNNRS
jgi:hypothetical protein